MNDLVEPPLPVRVTRETVCYFQLADPAARCRRSSRSSAGTYAHDFYALADPVHGVKAGAHNAGVESDAHDEAEPPTPMSPSASRPGRRERFDARRPGAGRGRRPASTRRRRTRRSCSSGAAASSSARRAPATASSSRPAIGERLAGLATRRRLPAMPTYQVRGEVPRKRHIQFRENGTLLTEEVMGLEGFSGNESILYHLTSPCRVKELGDVRADRARGVGARGARAPALRDGARSSRAATPIGGRQLLMWNEDVEISLCRPSRGDGLLLPQRRGRRGDLRPRGLRHARDDLRRPALPARRLRRRPARHDLPLRARGRAAAPRLRVAGPDRDPAPLPQRVRAAARARAVLPPRHPPADRAAHASASAASSRRPGAGQGRLPGRTSSTTTRSTSSAGTATSTRGRSRSTTSSRSPAASTCRRPRTRPSRAATS